MKYVHLYSLLSIAVCAALCSAQAAPLINLRDYPDLKRLKSPRSKISKNAELDTLQYAPGSWLITTRTNPIAKRTLNTTQYSSDTTTQALSEIESSLSELELAINKLNLDITINGKTRILATGLIVSADRQAISQIRNLKQVKETLPVYDYQLEIKDSAQYIGATQIISDYQLSGDGIRVAVLDSGIDYTHKSLGGSGTLEDYNLAIADPSAPPDWPQGNIVGGYDVINNDPNPIDNNIRLSFSHSTHVSHSILGVAPNASIYAYQICSGECPGWAQLQALEMAMDPNGDGDISDRVEVINMSIGGDFGNGRPNAVGTLLNQAAKLGVVATISAGNDGPVPFIVSGPSTTPNVISVGAMTHPTKQSIHVSGQFDQRQIKIRAARFNPSNEFDFTEKDTPLLYPTANQDACIPFASGLNFADKALLVNRGNCTFVTKVKNAQKSGASVVIVANNKPGQSPIYMTGDKDENLRIPAVMIGTDDGAWVKQKLTVADVQYHISSESITQAGAVASFSSRGPSIDGQFKPEITAPGVAILTAQAGTGDQLTPVDGTSFSSPIVAGALSLLAEAFPHRTAFELKATLMNSANRDVTIEPRSTNPDAELAPVSFIGAGLVDLERALTLPVSAWDATTKQGALEFGYIPASAPLKIQRKVAVKNFSEQEVSYQINLEQRFDNDLKTGAIQFEFPSEITVPAGQTVDILVTLKLDPSKLHPWELGNDTLQFDIDNNSKNLTLAEYDGALVFSIDDKQESFHLMYHILPKAVSGFDIQTKLTPEGSISTINNSGARESTPFTIPLNISSPPDPASPMDLLAVSARPFAFPFCTHNVGLAITMVTKQPIMLPAIAGFYMDLDVNRDGIYDYTINTLPYQAFDDTALPTDYVSFTHPYKVPRGGVFPIIHQTGEQHITQISCPERLGLTIQQLLSEPVDVRVRIEEHSFYFEPSGSPLDQVESRIRLVPSYLPPAIVDGDNKPIQSLSPVQHARLSAIMDEFILLAEDGSSPLIVSYHDKDQAPVIQRQIFSVTENAPKNHIIGKIVAQDANPVLSPITEFYAQSSSSNAIRVTKDGTLLVANSSMLDYEQALYVINMEVVAIDTHGNVSEPAKISVKINNLADTPEEQQTIEPTANAKGGSANGSALWLFALVAWFRRRCVHPNNRQKRG